MASSRKIPAVHQLKITLTGSQPPVWRRVRVPCDMTLAQLHDVIQASMGWTDGHLHQFVVGDAVYGPADADGLLECEDEEGVRLRSIARRPGTRFCYEYDFGDGWEHDVELEEVLDPSPSAFYPLCTDGGGACPPENSGGVAAYRRMLDVIGDTRHPRRARTLQQLGAGFDPELFVPDEANRRLWDRLELDSDEPYPQTLRAACMEVLSKQMRENDPPEVRASFERLRAEGYPEDEVWNLLGAAVVAEVFSTLTEEEPYLRERYIEALNALPRLPWEE